ncbi:MAG TPA: hypothetical protein VIR29_06830 [Anseongella sp.]
MNNREKLDLMDKVLRELEDLKNSQVALINKAAKLQVDNMELNDRELDEKLGDVHNELSGNLDLMTEVQIHFEERRDKFEVDNGLAETPEDTE